MRQYERNGVTIDQCSECRGIFLDRGELEKLTDAETSYYGRGQGEQAAPVGRPPPPPQPATQPFPQYDQIPPQAAPYRRPYGSPGSPDSPRYYGGQQDQYGRRRRKSFLSELFD